jgi:chromate transporter
MSPLPFREALRTWTRIGFLSFGGPAGQIALMHRVLVEEKRWIGEARFLHALNYCMLLPGPEAQQLATYVGWLLHGTRGGLAAGILFVLPGALCVLALAVLYAAFQRVPAVEALFFGLKAAVLALVIEAVLRIGKKVLRNRLMLALAALSFVAIFFLRAPFPLIVAAAGLFGVVGSRRRSEAFRVLAAPKAPGAHGPPREGAPLADAVLELRRTAAPSLRRTLAVVGTWLAVWFVPLALLALVLGGASVFVRMGLFFSRAALVTFGGAYAVLGYVSQHAVQREGWVQAGEMLDGLGLAETTPGPLILVLEFVAYLTGHRHGAPLGPVLGGVLGALVCLWATFAPCFLWIFAGAPYVEALREDRRASAALACITAAVVGVVLNLALWFGLHVLFGTVHERDGYGLRVYAPDLRTLDASAALLSVMAAFLLFRTRLGVPGTLASTALAGLLLRLA